MCKCSQKDCDLEVFENSDKCILHCEKNDWYEADNNGNKNWDNSKRNINLFWNQIKKDLDSEYEDSFDRNVLWAPYIYTHIIFPKFQNDIPYHPFEMWEEIFATNFYSYISSQKRNINMLNRIFEKLKIKFENCIFLEKTDFSKYSFKNDILFDTCIFFSDVIFEKMIFTNEFKFINCTVLGLANFKKTNFNKVVAFEKTIFNNVEFTNTRFNKISRFINTIFNEKVDFKDTYFNEFTSFNNAEIKNEINLDTAIFFNASSFYGIKYENIANRETARIIKDSFEQQNNIIEANKFYALEMKEMEKELKFFEKPFEWLIFKIHGMASNHSQDFLLALFWIINITFVTVFLKYDLICENSFIKSFDRLLFFFAGLTLLGYGISRLKEKFRNITIILFTTINYLIYSSSFIDDGNLKLFSNTLNPFSIMTGKEELTFDLLLYKITIAYLIYQLIISIRQNTRRK